MKRKTMVKSGKYITFIKVAEVAEDWSGWLLEDWLKYGFRECEWCYAYEEWQNRKKWDEMGKKCPVCFALDGQRFKIQDVLDKATHNAPKYSLSHVNCHCKFKRIPREQEQLDYAEAAKEETVTPTTVSLPSEIDRLADIGWGQSEIDAAIKDLFTRNNVEVSQEETDSIIQEVKDYSEGLSMKSKSNSYDQIWRAIQRSTWKKLKEKKPKASLMGFIKTAKETQAEMLKW